MCHPDPELAILSWLKACDQNVSFFLLRHYFFMTSERSDDFVLDAAASLTRFQHLLTLPEFPQRRLARILHVRTLFSFIFDHYTITPPQNHKVSSINHAYQVKAKQSWEAVCREFLPDDVLKNWLLNLEEG